MQICSAALVRLGERYADEARRQVNLLPTTCHIYFGSVTGATPDGRHAWAPLSEGISPVQGADRHGPTAVLKSAAKLDHVRTGGTLLNQKLTPQLLSDETGLDALVSLIRAYFKLDGTTFSSIWWMLKPCAMRRRTLRYTVF